METLNTTGFLFTETTLTLSLLTADFGDGYEANALTGSPHGVRGWSMKIDVLPDSYSHAAAVEGDTRAEYLWQFFLRSKAAGNQPFWFEDPKDGKFYLAKFADDTLSYSILCAKIYSTGLQLKQRRIRSTAGAPRTGLIYRDTFATLSGWTNGGSWSVDSDVPALVAAASSDPSVAFAGTAGGADAMGVREGIIYVEDDTWYLLYDAGNGVPATSGYVWRMFLATSTDRGQSWVKEGPLSIGFAKSNNPADGNWASRACGYMDKFSGTYYLHTNTADALAGSEIPAGHFFSDVWSGPSPRGPWTFIRQELTAGGSGDFDSRYAYGCCVVQDPDSAGDFYLFYGGYDGTTNNIGLATAAGPAGPWFRVWMLLDPALAGNPENAKVFWHAGIARWVMTVNQINTGLGKTTWNSIFISDNLTDWTAAQRYDFQQNFPIDSSGLNIIGVPSPFYTEEGLPLFEAGKLPISFDGDTDDSTSGAHHGRRIKFSSLEPAPHALHYNAVDTTVRLLSRTLVHGDFIAEFEVDASQFGTSAQMCFDFRLDTPGGNTGYRIAVQFDNDLPGRYLLLQKRTAGIWATLVTGSGSGLILPGTSPDYFYMNRVRIVAVGARIEAYLGGELQVNYEEATYLSGAAIAFAGYNIEAHVRLLEIYASDTVVLNNVAPGDLVTLRGPAGQPVKQLIATEAPMASIVHNCYAAESVQVGDEILTAELTNWALASRGATATASSNAGSDYLPVFANDGLRVGLNSNTGYWASATGTAPHTLVIDFGELRAIQLINLFTCQSNPAAWLTPTLELTFSQYGARAFTLEYWDGADWQAVPGGAVTGNNKVWRQFAGLDISTTKLRVTISDSSDDYGRIAELEAWGSIGIWGGSVLNANRIPL